MLKFFNIIVHVENFYFVIPRKIELITSFAAKSDSSSDEEKHREGVRYLFQKKYLDYTNNPFSEDNKLC